MNSISLIESFTELKNQKLLDRSVLHSIVYDVLESAILKQFGEDSNIDIIMNTDNGDIEIWKNLTVVNDNDISNTNSEITLSQVIKIEPDFEVGEQYCFQINISDIDRRNILAIKQNLKSKIKDWENKLIYEKFTELIGELYTAEVHIIKKDHIILIDDNGVEFILPKSNQIPRDFFRKGESVNAIIDSCVLESGKLKIIMSRTSDVFLERIMEQEIPEIWDELIEIKLVKRIPGLRSKVIVEAIDDRIDPVGCCVGVKGSKINIITKKLNGEYIDIINWTNNKELLIKRALEPVKIKTININKDNATVELISNEDISKVIGKGGANIKLASQITGFNIDIRNSNLEEEDVLLIDFNDEIEQWIIDEFIKVGLDTAKSVLKFTPDYLQKITDLEEETIDEVFSILSLEFKNPV